MARKKTFVTRVHPASTVRLSSDALFMGCQHPENIELRSLAERVRDFCRAPDRCCLHGAGNRGRSLPSNFAGRGRSSRRGLFGTQKPAPRD
jgi:hypothetical protein